MSVKTTGITHLPQQAFAFCKASRFPDNSRMTCSVTSKISIQFFMFNLEMFSCCGSTGVGALLIEEKNVGPNRIRRLDAEFV